MFPNFYYHKCCTLRQLCLPESHCLKDLWQPYTERTTAGVPSSPHLARPWIVTDILYISHIPTSGLYLLAAKQPVRHALASFRHCTNYAIHLVQLHVSWARRRSTPVLCGLCGYLFGPPGALGVINIRLWRHLYHSHTIYLRGLPPAIYQTGRTAAAPLKVHKIENFFLTPILEFALFLC